MTYTPPGTHHPLPGIDSGLISVWVVSYMTAFLRQRHPTCFPNQNITGMVLTKGFDENVTFVRNHPLSAEACRQYDFRSLLFFQADDGGYDGVPGCCPSELKWFIKFIPAVVNALIIKQMKSLFDMIAYLLNDLENYQTQADHERWLVTKMVTLKFVSTFSSLFYTAFWVQDMSKLRRRILIMLIIDQVRSNEYK